MKQSEVRVVLDTPELNKGVINMLRFERYTVEQLEHWIWGWENLPSLRLLFTEEDYKRVVELLSEKSY
jgi:hypothetical protein